MGINYAKGPFIMDMFYTRRCHSKWVHFQIPDTHKGGGGIRLVVNPGISPDFDIGPIKLKTEPSGGPLTLKFDRATRPFLKIDRRH